MRFGGWAGVAALAVGCAGGSQAPGTATVSVGSDGTLYLDSISGALPAAKYPVATRTATVDVLFDGKIQLDGKPGTLAEVEARFAQMAGGTVHYSRESAIGDQDRVALRVLEAAFKHHVRVALEPDLAGSLRPRKAPGR